MAAGRRRGRMYVERVVPGLAPTGVDALPASAVIVLAPADRQYRMLAERLNPIPTLDRLPPPPPIWRPHVAPTRMEVLGAAAEGRPAVSASAASVPPVAAAEVRHATPTEDGSRTAVPANGSRGGEHVVLKEDSPAERYF